jgi:pantothenate synthetase
MLAVLREVPGIEIDYVEIVDPETLMPLASAKDSMALLVAVRIGRTRLIDNLVIH